MNKKIYIFVYGTLKKGTRQHNRLMKNAEFVGIGTTTTKYVMCNYGYPMIFEDKNGHIIKGEVYKIPISDLYILDRYEGYPSLYKRKIEKIRIGNKEMDAYIYYNTDRRHLNCKYTVEPNIYGELEWQIA